jgi:hypothetical protein
VRDERERRARRSADHLDDHPQLAPPDIEARAARDDLYVPRDLLLRLARGRDRHQLAEETNLVDGRPGLHGGLYCGVIANNGRGKR